MHDHNPHYHSFCSHCCHPAGACCCCVPECRREPKELVIVPKTGAVDQATLEVHQMAMSMLSMPPEPTQDTSAETGASEINLLRMKKMDAQTLSTLNLGTGTAFIGGGCCVHLSVEYMPESATASADGIVLVAVTDSEGTVLAWGKQVNAHSSYEIKENIITTNPGAKLLVYAVNLIVRVRWCEIFSC